MLEPEFPATLIADVLAILQQNTDGVSEHTLLKELDSLGYTEFTPSLEPLALFQAHFMLFHLLYRQQDIWQQQGFGKLNISCMNIGFSHNFTAATHNHPCHDDPLRRYYLDFAAYRETQTQDVIDLLNNFWRKVPAMIDNKELEQAKITLELPLDQTLNRQQINQHYRRLSFSHHPDRGGNTQLFQQLNHAIQILRKAYPA